MARENSRRRGGCIAQKGSACAGFVARLTRRHPREAYSIAQADACRVLIVPWEGERRRKDIRRPPEPDGARSPRSAGQARTASSATLYLQNEENNTTPPDPECKSVGEVYVHQRGRDGAGCANARGMLANDTWRGAVMFVHRGAG